MTQAIQTEIALLRDTKGELRNAIMEKGVTVYSSDLFSTYPTRISQISMTPGDKDNLFTDLMERDVTSVTIPTGTEIIRQDCFSDCTSLASVTIPSTVLTIERNSFYKTALTTVEIPDSVESIGVEAFGECTSLTTVTIGSGVSIIEVSAFEGCTSLTSITCTSETPATIESGVFYNTNNCPIYVPSDSVDAYKTAWSTYADRIQAIQVPVPAMKWTSSDGTQEISIDCEDLATAGTLANDDRTAADPDNLITNVEGSAEIGDCVTTIGRNAFGFCSSLASVNIPSGVTSIGQGAFSMCTSLTSANIPDSVTTIGESAFFRCTSLTSVTIGNSVTSIGRYGFYGCSSLTSITVNATTPPTLANSNLNPFDDTNDCPIYVPAASVNTYKAASVWSTYASRIQAIP